MLWSLGGGGGNEIYCCFGFKFKGKGLVSNISCVELVRLNSLLGKVIRLFYSYYSKEENWDVVKFIFLFLRKIDF